jgi:hypothetical protein
LVNYGNCEDHTQEVEGLSTFQELLIGVSTLRKTDGSPIVLCVHSDTNCHLKRSSRVWRRGSFERMSSIHK